MASAASPLAEVCAGSPAAEPLHASPGEPSQAAVFGAGVVSASTVKPPPVETVVRVKKSAAAASSVAVRQNTGAEIEAASLVARQKKHQVWLRGHRAPTPTELKQRDVDAKRRKEEESRGSEGSRTARLQRHKGWLAEHKQQLDGKIIRERMLEEEDRAEKHIRSHARMVLDEGEETRVCIPADFLKVVNTSRNFSSSVKIQPDGALDRLTPAQANDVATFLKRWKRGAPLAQLKFTAGQKGPKKKLEGQPDPPICEPRGSTELCKGIGRVLAGRSARLTSLHIAGLKFTAVGCEKLGEGITSSPSLRNLNLARCEGIGDSGIEVLAKGMQRCAPLCLVDLSELGLTDASAPHLVNMLKIHADRRDYEKWQANLRGSSIGAPLSHSRRPSGDNGPAIGSNREKFGRGAGGIGGLQGGGDGGSQTQRQPVSSLSSSFAVPSGVVGLFLCSNSFSNKGVAQFADHLEVDRWVGMLDFRELRHRVEPSVDVTFWQSLEGLGRDDVDVGCRVMLSKAAKKKPVLSPEALKGLPPKRNKSAAPKKRGGSTVRKRSLSAAPSRSGALTMNITTHTTLEGGGSPGSSGAGTATGAGMSQLDMSGASTVGLGLSPPASAKTATTARKNAVAVRLNSTQSKSSSHPLDPFNAAPVDCDSTAKGGGGAADYHSPLGRPFHQKKQAGKGPSLTGTGAGGYVPARQAAGKKAQLKKKDPAAAAAGSSTKAAPSNLGSSTQPGPGGTFSSTDSTMRIPPFDVRTMQPPPPARRQFGAATKKKKKTLLPAPPGAVAATTPAAAAAIDPVSSPEEVLGWMSPVSDDGSLGQAASGNVTRQHDSLIDSDLMASVSARLDQIL